MSSTSDSILSSKVMDLKDKTFDITKVSIEIRLSAVNRHFSTSSTALSRQELRKEEVILEERKRNLRRESMRGSPSGVALDFDYILSEFDDEPIFQSGIPLCASRIGVGYGETRPVRMTFSRYVGQHSVECLILPVSISVALLLKEVGGKVEGTEAEHFASPRKPAGRLAPFSGHGGCIRPSRVRTCKLVVLGSLTLWIQWPPWMSHFRRRTTYKTNVNASFFS
ncbi:hypothetical protein BDR22DRAFT_819186 [Usnea florida]